MTAVIDTLIDKQDTFEIVRDKIALILAEESAAQQALAVAAGEDPTLWELRVYTEQSNPFESWLNNQADLSNIVNVWFESWSLVEGASNTISSQHIEAVYNLDVYGIGISADDGAGQFLGDAQAAFASHRGARLVRNILMAGVYTYLDLRGSVGRRMVQTVSAFQPDLRNLAMQNIMGTRLQLRVLMEETSPQVSGDPLERVVVELKRAEDGQILAGVDIDYTGV